MKKEEINFLEIEKSINNIKELSENVRTSLQGADNLIKDNVANNSGIWDGTSATAFLTRWNDLSENIPTYITMFEEQSLLLENYLKTMQNVEE